MGIRESQLKSQIYYQLFWFQTCYWASHLNFLLCKTCKITSLSLSRIWSASFYMGVGWGPAWHSEKPARSVLWYLVRLQPNDMPTWLSLMPGTRVKKIISKPGWSVGPEKWHFSVSLMELEPWQFCKHPLTPWRTQLGQLPEGMGDL